MRRSSVRTGRNSNIFRPRLESLEGRLCLSVTVSTIALDSGNELRIVGDSGADTVNISDQGNGHIDVTNGKGKVLGSADDVSVIRFNGKDGKDTVSYTLANPLTNTEKLILNLGGGGKNQAAIDLSQGISGADLHVTVNGGSGADTIGATLGSLSSAKLVLDVDGGAGKDAISVTGSGVNISDDSVLKLDLAGGDGADTIATVFDGVILGKLVSTIEGGKGADTVTANITANSTSSGTLKAIERGGKGLDNVTLNVIDDSGDPDSTLAALHATIFDASGLDSLTHTDNVTIKPIATV